MSAGPLAPPSATNRPRSGSDTSAIAVSARIRRRPRSGASATGSSTNGANLNQPAIASMPVASAGRRHSRTAAASIAASTGSVVPVDTVMSRGGNASQASAARSPASSTSGGRRVPRSASPGDDHEHDGGRHQRRHHRHRESTVDRVPRRVDRRGQCQRCVENVGEDRVGVPVDYAGRKVAVRQHAVDQPRGAFHRGVEHVDGTGRADSDHHKHERQHGQQPAQPPDAPRRIEAGGKRDEQRTRRGGRPVRAEGDERAAQQQVEHRRSGRQHARAQVAVLEQEHGGKERERGDDVEIAKAPPRGHAPPSARTGDRARPAPPARRPPSFRTAPASCRPSRRRPRRYGRSRPRRPAVHGPGS